MTHPIHPISSGQVHIGAPYTTKLIQGGMHQTSSTTDIEQFSIQALQAHLSLHLHQRGKNLVLPHLARLLRSEEFDQLDQFLARGVFELACWCGRHRFGEDGEAGRG